MNSKTNYTPRDHAIRQMLESTAVPEELKNRILAKQIKKLQAMKDIATPGWRRDPPEPVEIHTYAEPHRGLDGMVRHTHKD